MVLNLSRSRFKSHLHEAKSIQILLHKKNNYEAAMRGQLYMYRARSLQRTTFYLFYESWVAQSVD